ncbi:MAG: SDR family NAD(P)-dependent oxidoreductase [Acidimicrobiales bacterium]
MEELSGKVAVVTGAGSGMGKAFARRFAAEGMKVVLADVQVDALEGAVAELSDAGHEVLGVPTDVSGLRALRNLADQAVGTFGKVHLVCNNAGVEGYLDGALWEATDEDWAWTLDVNFWGVVNGVRTFLPLLLSHGEPGHLVNTASMTALTRAANMYSVTKHAVLALTEVLHAELRARGAPVGVSALCPGIIATRLFQGSRNRPRALRNRAEGPGARGGRELREQMHARLAQGMSPETVADKLLEAIRADRLYVLTDHDWDGAIRERSEDILAGRNPSPPGGASGGGGR